MHYDMDMILEKTEQINSFIEKEVCKEGFVFKDILMVLNLCKNFYVWGTIREIKKKFPATGREELFLSMKKVLDELHELQLDMFQEDMKNFNEICESARDSLH